jgi:hypothetical protein
VIELVGACVSDVVNDDLTVMLSDRNKIRLYFRVKNRETYMITLFASGFVKVVCRISMTSLKSIITLDSIISAPYFQIVLKKT